MTAVSSGVERREFLRRAGMLGVGLSLPSGLLAACGSDAGSGAGTTGGGTRGGVLSIGATDWLPPDFFLGNSLGPWLLGMSQMAWGLFRGGGGSGRGFELQNGLASGYEVSPDGLVHTVRLRRGMVFHDGSPIDADAVVANLKAAFFARDPLRDRGTYVQVIITLGSPPIVRSVEAVDPHTVRITLTEARVDIRVALAFLLIFNPKVLANKDYGTDVQALRDAGSGPFRLTNWQAKSFMELERFDRFFEDVLPDRVRLQGIPDAGALALAARGGEISVVSGLAKSDFDSLSRTGGHRIVASDPAVNVDLVLSKPKDPIFDDERVRRAILLAMDRQAYTDRFFNSGSAQLSSEPIIVDGIPGFVPGLQAAPHDTTAARALMAQAGAKSPKLTIAGPTAQAPVSDFKALMEAIAADLGAIGIDASVDVQDPTAFSDALDHGRVEAFVSAPGGQADPFILFDLFYRGPYMPGATHTVPSIARNLDAAHKARTAGERDRLLQQVMRDTVDRQLVLPISWVAYSVLADGKVTDFPLTCTQLDSWHRVSVST